MCGGGRLWGVGRWAAHGGASGWLLRPAPLAHIPRCPLPPLQVFVPIARQEVAEGFEWGQAWPLRWVLRAVSTAARCTGSSGCSSRRLASLCPHPPSPLPLLGPRPRCRSLVTLAGSLLVGWPLYLFFNVAGR